MSFPIISVILTCLFLTEFHNFAGAQGIGVCYGRSATQLPKARKAIALCKSKNIQRIYLYDPNHDALHALKNTGIEVIVEVAQDDIVRLTQDRRFARYWVNMNVVRYAPYVNFRCIVVGHGVIPGTDVLPALTNLQYALNCVNLSIPVSTLVRPYVLETAFPPSAGSFGPGPNPVLPVVQFLQTNGYPLVVIVNSYYEYVSDPAYINFPLEFALLESGKFVVQDGGLGYTTIMDALVDAFYSAMEKVGATNVEVIVTEAGWPAETNSGLGTSITTVVNAQTHNSNLIKRLRMNTGTPKRPYWGLETYIFSLFTQDLLGSYWESYGLFYPNGTDVYPLDFWYTPPR